MPTVLLLLDVSIRHVPVILILKMLAVFWFEVFVYMIAITAVWNGQIEQPLDQLSDAAIYARRNLLQYKVPGTLHSSQSADVL